VTALGNVRRSVSGGNSMLVDGTDALLALAVRPLSSDRAGLLFSYNLNRTERQTTGLSDLVGERLGTLSADGFFEPIRRVEWTGRVAVSDRQVKFPGESFLSTTSYLFQTRGQWRFWKRFDLAAETMLMLQPVSDTRRVRSGVEAGFWLTSELRAAAGYGFRSTGFGDDLRANSVPNGPYFALNVSISRLFGFRAGADDAASQ